MSDDRQWTQRVRLFNILLIDVVDRWCRGDASFPVKSTVASLLYLFSAQADPFSIAEKDLQKALLETVDSPAAEYARAWPSHDARSGSELVAALSQIIESAIDRWEHGSLTNPTVSSVGQELIEAILDFGYVTFHHYLTTRRDGGGFHAHW
ncbi:MAG: hypothetical protein AB7U73_23985 [Pirellulales bacterium]